MSFEEFIDEWKNDNEYIIVKTSGSTGEPKLIKLFKTFVRESGKRTNDYFKLGEKSRLHSCVGAEFIGGKMMAVRAELVNARFTWEKPSNEPLKDIKKDECLDLVAVVPSQMVYLVENLEFLPKIRSIIIGGSPIHQDLREKIANSGLNAYETYGMTETASHIALRKIESKDHPFKLLPGIKISTDYEDCLKIRFDDGIEIQTNDIAELVSENEFYIKGRRDQIIISGGRKINPLDIEKRIAHMIENPFLITGFPDEKWGEKVVLIIEGEENAGIKTSINDVLEKWEKPKDIYFVKKLPRTENGKIKRIKSL